MKTIRTEKGTELPILNLKGKDYLQVAHRLVWFRERHPDWSIETDYVFQNESSAFCRAVIKDGQGRIMATSHKEESLKDFALGYREKAETGSIGRALALCGFGTQFEPEFDEGHRVVDSPMSDPQRILPEQPMPGDGIQKDGYHFGSMGGPRLAQRHISDVPTEDLKKFVEDMDKKYHGKDMPPKTLDAHSNAINEILKREGVLDEQADKDPESFQQFGVITK